MYVRACVWMFARVSSVCFVCVCVEYCSIRLAPQCSNICLVIYSFHSLPARLLMCVIHVCTSSIIIAILDILVLVIVSWISMNKL